MLIELNGTQLVSGRHSAGGVGETAVLVMQPGSQAGPGPLRQFQNVAMDQEQEHEEQEHEPGNMAAVPSSMEHQIQARLSIVDKRLHQAMYNAS